MMRAIAKRFSEGGFTLPELATELDMGQDALLERLFMMERLGFIVRSGGCTWPPRAEDALCRCSGCSGCREVTGYALTGKGRRLAGTKGPKGEVV
ncbi:MAG TPA: hypothetical protein PKK41_08000 [Methanoculleus sp.]|jgi:hypothetical protein|nr:hypothetical protein [Methanoculleus sp.]HOD86534.1 hypothetical protein [Methanoculleus sp.]HUM78195.1 hypothetical protein [Methanoculleus sp.]